MKKILSILALSIGLFSFGLAQTNGNFKTVRLVNVLDSTTISPINSTIYYNEQVKALKAYVNNRWVTVVDSSGNVGPTVDVSGWVGISAAQYGAVCDGVTNDHDAFQAAYDSGNYVVYVPISSAGCLVNGEILVPEGGALLGSAKGKAILKTTSNAPIITIDGKGDFTVSDIWFQGNDTGASQRGINAQNYPERLIIQNCNFTHFKQYGIYILHNDFAVIQSCYFAYNESADIFLDQLSEQNVIANNTFLYGGGIKVAGGNNIISTNSLAYTNYGIQVVNGTNAAHGIAVGNVLDHCASRGILCSGIALGFNFYDNNLYTSNLEILNSADVHVSGGTVQSSTFVQTNSTGIIYEGIREATAISWSITGTAPIIIKNSGPFEVLGTNISTDGNLLQSTSGAAIIQGATSSYYTTIKSVTLTTPSNSPTALLTLAIPRGTIIAGNIMLSWQKDTDASVSGGIFCEWSGSNKADGSTQTAGNTTIRTTGTTTATLSGISFTGESLIFNVTGVAATSITWIGTFNYTVNP